MYGLNNWFIVLIGVVIAVFGAYVVPTDFLGLSNLEGGVLGEGELAAVIDIANPDILEEEVDLSSVISDEIVKEEIESVVEIKEELAESPVLLEPILGPVKVETVVPSVTEPIISFCLFNVAGTPSHKDLIINEIAWMGSVNSANDEWIELKNISGQELDLSGWQLVDLGEQIKIQLDGKLPAGGLYLLERTDDNSLPLAVADKIYTGALGNVGEGLRLFAPQCVLVDGVMAAPDWPGGDSLYKRTAERTAALLWQFSSETGGTPKLENSAGFVLPVVEENNSSYPTPPDNQEQPLPENNQNNPAPATSNVTHILISEVLFDVEGSDTGKEFIEIYNPTNQAADISSWSIQHLSGSGSLTKKNFEAGDNIAPKSFFLIWLGSNSQADMTWSSGSLNNTSATIYLVDNQDLVSTTTTLVVVDTVNYDIAALSGFVAGQSLERETYSGSCVSAQGSSEYLGNGCDTDSASDFELRAIPNPQNAQSLPEPR